MCRRLLLPTLPSHSSTGSLSSILTLLTCVYLPLESRRKKKCKGPRLTASGPILKSGPRVPLLVIINHSRVILSSCTNKPMEYVSGSAARAPFMNPRSAFLPARKRPSQESLQPIKSAPPCNFTATLHSSRSPVWSQQVGSGEATIRVKDVVASFLLRCLV